MSDLSDILLTGERRMWVENGLIPKVVRFSDTVQIKLRDVRTYNDMLEVAEYAKNIEREIRDLHDNWRLLDGARKD